MSVVGGLGGRGRTPRAPWAQAPPADDERTGYNWVLLSIVVGSGVLLVGTSLATNYRFGWEGIWPSVFLELGAGMFLGAWFIVLENRVERRVEALRRDLTAQPSDSWDEHIALALSERPGTYEAWRALFRALSERGPSYGRAWRAVLDPSDLGSSTVSLDISDDHLRIAVTVGRWHETALETAPGQHVLREIVDPRPSLRHVGAEWWAAIPIDSLLDELRFKAAVAGMATEHLDTIPQLVRRLPISLATALEVAESDGVIGLVNDDWLLVTDGLSVSLRHRGGWQSDPIPRPDRSGVAIPQGPSSLESGDWARLVERASNLSRS